MNSNERDIWIDNVKVIACILVVLGHFFQSMVKSNLIAETFAYDYFEDTIYYFHVPLFFICSGYLFQKYSTVNNFEAWKNNVIKKIIALGIPYFTFSFLTWLLKKIFTSSVNSQLGSLSDTFFKHPASPYWYLYILFIIFVITFTTNGLKNQYILLVVSLILKLLILFVGGSGVYFIDNTMNNWIWFVLGMMLTYGVPHLCGLVGGLGGFVLFLLGSFWFEIERFDFRFGGFLLALLACYSLISIIYSTFSTGKQIKTMAIFSKYTMPIFLMHTMFAAPFRSILLKLGITHAIIHFTVGLIISFVGPIIAMEFLYKIKPLDFLVYPNKYIKLRGGK